MLFALICKDKPEHLHVRMDARADHVAFLKTLNEAGKLKFAGPFFDDDGKPNGGLVVIEAADRAEAAAMGSQDPFARADLFQSVEIRQWSWAFNNPA
jgi:uncharacterized protein YciI